MFDSAGAPLPRLIPGPVNGDNRDALAWGPQNLIAYGCHNHVVIVEASSGSVVQALPESGSTVTRVLWSQYIHPSRQLFLGTGSSRAGVSPSTNSPLKSTQPKDGSGGGGPIPWGATPGARLVVGDGSGVIQLWDVAGGSSVWRSFDPSNRSPVLGLAWVGGSSLTAPGSLPQSESGLLSLHYPSNVLMWDASTGSPVWSVSLGTSTALSLSLSPWNPRVAALAMSSGWIVTIEDLAVSSNSPPKKIRKRYRLASPGASQGSQGSSITGVDGKSDNQLTGDDDRVSAGVSGSVGNAPSGTVGGTAGGSGGSGELTKLAVVQMLHSPFEEHLLYIALPHEVVLFDTVLEAPVGSFHVESSLGKISKLVLAPHDPTRLVLMHERTSTLSFWSLSTPMEEATRARGVAGSIALGAAASPSAQLRLDGRGNTAGYKFVRTGTTDLMRTTRKGRPVKGNAVYGLVASPSIDGELCSLTADGRVWFWYASTNDPIKGEEKASPSVVPKLMGMTSGLPGHVSSMACRADYLAIGTASGLLQIWHLPSMKLRSEFAMHSKPVRGVTWVDSSTVISFSCDEPAEGKWKNRVVSVNIANGEEFSARSVPSSMTAGEPSYIRGIRVSSRGQYLVVLLKDRPFEIWNLATSTLVRCLASSAQQVTTLVWSPMSFTGLGSQAGPFSESREFFIFTLADGSLHYFLVDDAIVQEGPHLPIEFGMGLICALEWHGETLICGDINGAIGVWSFTTGKSTVLPAPGRGHVRRLRIAPDAARLKLLSLSGEGEYTLWDLDLGAKLNTPGSRAANDIAWASKDHAVLAGPDGTIRLMDLATGGQGSRALSASWLEMVHRAPFSLPWRTALSVKVALLCPDLIDKTSRSVNELWWLCGGSEDQEKPASPSPMEESVGRLLADSLNRDPEGVRRLAEVADLPVWDRALAVADLAGDRPDGDFWRVVKAYLTASESTTLVSGSTWTEGGSGDGGGERESTPEPPVVAVPSPAAQDDGEESGARSSYALPPSFGWMQLDEGFKRVAGEAGALHAARRGTSRAMRLVAVTEALALGNKNHAIQLLLETAPDAPEYGEDSMKACVIAASISDESFAHTVKSVALSFVTVDRIQEGVALMGLIGRHADAARYLQNFERWAEAGFLAKMHMHGPARVAVFHKWAEYLAQGGRDLWGAVYVCIAAGDWAGAARHLASPGLRRADLGALLMSAAKEAGRLKTASGHRSSWMSFSVWLAELGLTNLSSVAKSNLDLRRNR